ncbi:MAG: efflux RND transporter permease subunit, partial [Verrucomicrobiota bacterium]|nr:efflux RND transporter permease subunit [Verrucomicrobiota bacterium]
GSVPGISIETGKKALQQQDALIKSVPEVKTVFGKVGRSRSPTDPAGLSMVESTIELKDASEWRPGMTFEKIRDELKQKLGTFPGMPAIWWMPIQTRTEMLSTGIRSNIGIKILGPNLAGIQKLAEVIEGRMKMIKGAGTVVAERITGGYFIDFTVKRKEAARFGLTVKNVEDIIETAIGGKNIIQNVEGRERYPVNIRYPRELRNDPEALARVLISTPSGNQIPIGQVADIKITMGPPSIRDENGRLAGFVYVDVSGRDLGSFVAEGRKAVRENVKLPPGYSIEWAGQFKYMEAAAQKLRIAIPITIVLIFLLIYLNFGNVTETVIVMLSVPFALIGGYWLLYLLGYNMSVAVAVGFIALAGVATQTSIVMIVYLDEAYSHAQREGRMKTAKDLEASVIYGAVQRARPVVMTATAMIIGLLPIMFGHGTGSDVMKRIAAPMVGGLVTSTILTLLIIPAVYFIWKWYTDLRPQRRPAG